MTRITRADLEQSFGIFIRTIGGKVAERYDDHGAYSLRHEPNGWIIYQISQHTSGVNEPFGARRRTAREMFDAMNFAIDAAQIAKGER